MSEILPEDGTSGTLVGRVNTAAGPSVVAVRKDGVFDITRSAATVADLCNAADPVRWRGYRVSGWACWKN